MDIVKRPEQALKDTAERMVAIIFDPAAEEGAIRSAALTLVEVVAPDVLSDFLNADHQYELSEDLPCPKCGSPETHWRYCDSFPCDDGYCDEHEHDPLNFAPGESFTLCRECFGTAVQRWCSECGYDITAHNYRTAGSDRSEER